MSAIESQSPARTKHLLDPGRFRSPRRTPDKDRYRTRPSLQNDSGFSAMQTSKPVELDMTIATSQCANHVLRSLARADSKSRKSLAALPAPCRSRPQDESSLRVAVGNPRNSLGDGRQTMLGQGVTHRQLRRCARPSTRPNRLSGPRKAARSDRPTAFDKIVVNRRPDDFDAFVGDSVARHRSAIGVAPQHEHVVAKTSEIIVIGKHAVLDVDRASLDGVAATAAARPTMLLYVEQFRCASRQMSLFLRHWCRFGRPRFGAAQRSGLPTSMTLRPIIGAGVRSRRCARLRLAPGIGACGSAFRVPPLLLRRYVIICSSSAAFIPGRPRVLPQAVFGLISG